MIRPRYPQVLPLTNGRGKLIEIMNMTEITPISSCHEERLRGTSSSSKLNRSNTPNPVPSQPCPVTAQLLSFAWYHQVNFPLLTLSGHLSHVLFFLKKSDPFCDVWEELPTRIYRTSFPSNTFLKLFFLTMPVKNWYSLKFSHFFPSDVI